MNKGNTIEDFFCKQFIKSGYQDRFFFELSSNKKRVKAISRICHNMMDIINENKIVEVYNSTDAKNGADCYSKNGDAVTVLTWQS